MAGPHAGASLCRCSESISIYPDTSSAPLTHDTCCSERQISKEYTHHAATVLFFFFGIRTLLGLREAAAKSKEELEASGLLLHQTGDRASPCLLWYIRPSIHYPAAPSP